MKSRVLWFENDWKTISMKTKKKNVSKYLSKHKLSRRQKIYMKFVSFRYRLSSNRNFLFTAAAMTKKDRRDKVIAQEEQKWLFEAYKTSLRCEIQAKSNERNLIVRAMSMWRLKTNELRSSLDRNLRRQMKSWHFFASRPRKLSFRAAFQ